MKKLSALLLAVLLIVVLLPVSALAAKTGFLGVGGYSESNASYGFEVNGTEIVYNGELDYNGYDEVYPGSVFYIPIYKQDEDYNTAQATDKQIKTDKVEVSYKALKNGKYIESVTIVDAKKEKITGLESGVYAKIQVSDDAPHGETIVDLKVVLSVNRISYQETEFNLAFGMENRTVTIDSSSVYGAQLPTRFEVENRFNGEVTFDMGGGVRYSVWVRQKNEYIIDYSNEVNEEISDMYPDGYLQFHNFKGDKDTFAHVGKLELPIDKSKFKGTDGKTTVFAYQISGRNLTALGSDVASYDSKIGTLTIRASALGEYVLSSRSLMRQVDPSAEENILQTGYAAETPSSEPQTTGTATQTPAPSVPSTPPTSVPSAPTFPENPATGGDSDTTASTVSTAPTAPVPVPMSTGSINASNVSTENPLTGDSAPVALAVTALLLGGGLALASRKKKNAKQD